MTAGPAAPADEPSDLHLFGRNLTRQQLEERIGRLSQVGGIRPFRFEDGRARDVRAMDVRTGTGLVFTIVVDRTLDVIGAEYRGLPLGWQAPAGLASPDYLTPAGVGYAVDFFGGLLTTCGLTAFGPPGKDQWGEWGQHGRINGLPAEEISARTIWAGNTCTFEISGTVRETRLFHENLRLERTWRARLGSSRVELTDRVTNDGTASTPHMLLYHFNVGYPLLDEDSRLHVSHTSLRPRDDPAKAGLAVWDRGGKPEPGFAEQVFIHDAAPLEDGWAAAVMVGRSHTDSARLALAIHYRVDQLPVLVEWRMLDSRTYVMGIEPANCPTIEGREKAGRLGTLPFLEPGEARTYDLAFEVLDGANEIDPLVAAIAARSGAAPPGSG
jgi:hypothetical protein